MDLFQSDKMQFFNLIFPFCYPSLSCESCPCDGDPDTSGCECWQDGRPAVGHPLYDTFKAILIWADNKHTLNHTWRIRETDDDGEEEG